MGLGWSLSVKSDFIVVYLCLKAGKLFWENVWVPLIISNPFIILY